jgi:2-polyprenylphenol 6-hydroxylase
VRRATEFDVLIAGGGMVGAVTAALVAGEPALAGARVALIEPRPARFPGAQDPLDLRVSALSRATEQALRSVGAWPRLAARAPCPYERMVVWDAADDPESQFALTFDAAELAEPNLGHIAENPAVNAALLEAAAGRGVRLLAEELSGLELNADYARVLMAGGERSARLVIAADGADSALRDWAGITGEGAAYHSRAVVTHLRPERPHQSTARQRFLPSGPLALLPLSDGRVSLVWSTSPEHAQQLAACEAAEFASAVTAASGQVLGRLEVSAPRASFPLRRFQAARYATTRLALVGDAAHTVHPLAGQGVNLGVLDAWLLSRTLAEAASAGEDLGDPGVLNRYARRRKAENALMGVALDGIARLFTDPRAPVGAARRAGLGLVNRAPWLKGLFMRQALGVARGAPPAPDPFRR